MIQKIASDPTKKWEKELTSCLREELLKKDYISKSLYFFLRPSDSRLPQLYGLPKIHKAGAPLRPIVSAIRSFNYNLGKLLVWLLTPYMTNCESYVKNSVDFASFQSKSRPGYSRQISFDVKSLFTNVPIKEAVQLALELIRSDTNRRLDIPIPVLQKLFEFTTEYCCFEFMGDFFLQTDGLSMGNPLAPPLSHLFMVKIEQKALNLGINFRVWKRYVDDVYCRLNKHDFERIPTILQSLNAIHQSIEFTAEKEENSQLPFLQVLTTKPVGNHKNYDTTVYRKPTHTNLYIRWDSAHPPSQKLGVFRTLLWSAKHICSSQTLYEREKAHLLQVFTELGYPYNRLQWVIKKIENPISGPRNKSNAVNLCLPYIEGTSEKVASLWKKLVKKYELSDVQTSITYQPMSKLKSLLVKPYKKDPDGQCVYRATCQNCGKVYIGETGLLLSSRQKSHALSQNSALREHCSGVTGFSFEMIARSHNASRRKIRESLEIHENNPELNENTGIFPYIFK